MKKSLAAFALMLAATSGVQAQEYNNDAHLGIKAGVNFSNIRLTENVPSGASSGWLTRPVGGFFGNIPFAKRWSVQLEGLYSTMGGTYEPGGSDPSSKVRLDYISLPMMFKFHASPKFKVVLGGEWDVLLSAEAENDQTGEETDIKDRLRGDDFGLTGGFEFWPGFNWVIQARYIYGLTDVAYKFPPTTRNQAIQLTLGYRFGKKPVPLPPPPPPVLDTDNDGVLDPNDKCPTVPGLAKYDGCPIPDTDKDGVNDEEDKCPTVAGLAKYQGCPIPDTDGDGINDEEDRCPDVAGVPEMLGCPKIDFQASDVTFQSGKAVLLAAGKKELDVVADFLNKNPSVKVSIEGHTDNSGTDKVNQPLSEKRAAAAKAYLVSKGVAEDRMTSSGYGSTQPVADNKTAAGKQKNRRVEIKVQ